MKILPNNISQVSNKNQYLQTNKNVQQNPENEKKLNNDLNQIALYNKSLINFQGNNIKLTKKDMAFITGLATTFGLSALVVDKLKQKLGDFLQDNNFISMDDIAGDDNLDVQLNLVEKLNETTNFKDNHYLKLMDSVLDRCYKPTSEENKKDSEPINSESFNDYDNLEIKKFKDLIKKSIELVKENDKKCLKAIGNAFRFNPTQQARLEEIVNTTLKENDLSSLKGLNDDDMIETTATLAEKITKEFNLSEDDSIILIAELSYRYNSQETMYEPSISSLDRNIEISYRDTHILNNIMEKNHINPNLMGILHRAMKQDASARNFNSIFELFNPNYELSNFENTNNVLNSNNFKLKKTDLLIDLNLAAKNIQAESAKIEDQEKNNMENISRIEYFICELDKLYNFSKDEIKNLKRFMTTEKYDLNNKENAAQIAYELSEFLNKESDYIEIRKIVKEINEMSKEDLDMCGFKYCQLLMKK